MAYCTQADVEQACGGNARLVQLTDWDSTGAVDVGRLTNAIAEADAEIDSYASKRFAVPMTNPVPEQIKRLSARLAVYRMRVARGLPSQSDLYTYEQDVKWLDAFSKGDVLAGIEPNPQHAEVVVDLASDRPTSKSVSRRKLRGFS